MGEVTKLIYKAHREHVQRLRSINYTCGFCGNKQRISDYVCAFCGTTNPGMPFTNRKGYNKSLKEL